MQIYIIAVIFCALALAGVGLMAALVYRRVVPTNMTHIVQSGKLTVSYGKGQAAGNVYYAWPAWMPKIGVNVLEFPESIFAIRLANYDAYDQVRLPFIVDVVAFFRIKSSEVAAQRVRTFAELEQQLLAVLQGAVRRILATNTLEKIMESRAELGEQFTQEVNNQIEEWGVTAVKSIEFMDLRDSHGSEVILNMMAREKSRIERESRVAVADNRKQAELAEIDAKRTVDVQEQDALLQVGLKTAEKDQEVGIANQKSVQAVQEQAKITAEKTMQVAAVNQEKAAAIEKNVQITQAEGEKQVKILAADAQLAETLKVAEGITARGIAEASAQEKLLMAPVTAQITLAKEIGGNQGYQTYLVTLEQVKAGKDVGMEMAAALAKADLKVISTGGGDTGMLPGVAKLADLFTPTGGTKLAGMLAGLAAAPEGQAMLAGLTQRLGGSTTATAVAAAAAVAD